MLRMKGRNIIWQFGNDDLVILRNTTEARLRQLKNELHRIYGTEYGLSEVKQVLITLK